MTEYLKLFILWSAQPFGSFNNTIKFNQKYIGLCGKKVLSANCNWHRWFEISLSIFQICTWLVESLVFNLILSTLSKNVNDVFHVTLSFRPHLSIFDSVDACCLKALGSWVFGKYTIPLHCPQPIYFRLYASDISHPQSKTCRLS